MKDNPAKLVCCIPEGVELSRDAHFRVRTTKDVILLGQTLAYRFRAKGLARRVQGLGCHIGVGVSGLGA